MPPPLQTLSRYGKSFRFAGALLPGQLLHNAARLYQFCRWVDDLVDDCPNPQIAREHLHTIGTTLQAQQSDQPLLADFIALQQEVGIDTAIPLALLDGMQSDLDTVAIQSPHELIRYAYRAAGTVGLMMCPILGAKKAGLPHAVDLGIAMQLTNIARDVAEDAAMGRRYLPQTWCPFSPQRLLSFSPQDRHVVQQAIQKVLQLAECYYASARIGLTYLPLRSRLAIATALVVYREIGVRLEQCGCAYWRGRVVVPGWYKCLLCASTLLPKTPNKTVKHNRQLHKPLSGLFQAP